MESNSPGKGNNPKLRREKSDVTRVVASSSLSDKVGFYEQVFRSSSEQGQGRTSYGTVSSAGVDGASGVHSSHDRVQVGYHGPRTDARDRSSEDPRRHRIPRASLSPASSPLTVPDSPDRHRSRSTSRTRDMSHRSWQHDDITISPVRRSQSGRRIRSPAGEKEKSPPFRSLSFRTSVNKNEDVHRPIEKIFDTKVTSGRVTSIPIKNETSYSLETTMSPNRPPRQRYRKSEPTYQVRLGNFLALWSMLIDQEYFRTEIISLGKTFHFLAIKDFSSMIGFLSVSAT